MNHNFFQILKKTKKKALNHRTITLSLFKKRISNIKILTHYCFCKKPSSFVNCDQKGDEEKKMEIIKLINYSFLKKQTSILP